MRRSGVGAAALVAALVTAGCSSDPPTGLVDVATSQGGAATTAAPAATSSSTVPGSVVPATGRPSSAAATGDPPAVAPDASLARLAPLDQVLGVAYDVLGTTTDVWGEMARIGNPDRQVPAYPGELDVIAYSVTGNTGAGRGTAPTMQIQVQARVPGAPDPVTAFYGEAALAPEWTFLGQDKTGDDTRYSYRLAGSAPNADSPEFSFRLDTYTSTADAAAFLISIDPQNQPDTAGIERMAGWSPEVDLPAGAELATASVSVLPTIEPMALLALTLEYRVPDVDPRNLATETAAALGLTDWKLTERANGLVGETFDLTPPAGLTTHELRIQGDGGSGSLLTITGKRDVPLR